MIILKFISAQTKPKKYTNIRRKKNAEFSNYYLQKKNV